MDGTITPEEWAGGNFDDYDPTGMNPFIIEQGIHGEKVTPQSLAWLIWDDAYLMLAIDNEVDPSKPLRPPGGEWGSGDMVEIALCNTAAGKDAPILVLRGYPSGHFESREDAWASPAAAQRAAEGVEYAARIVDASHWTAEFRLPFASLGIDQAKKHSKFAFNLSMKKTAQPLWLMWQGTGGHTWDVWNAGFIELIRPG